MPVNTNELTAAHQTLPFGSRVKVVHQKIRRSVVVRINDRGPYAHGRVIDLSWASAQATGLSGVAQVALLEM
jgi:rare lipoprotein A